MNKCGGGQCNRRWRERYLKLWLSPITLPALSQGPIGLTGRAGPTVSIYNLGRPQSFWTNLLSKAAWYLSSSSPLSCLPDRVTQGLLERREILGDLAPQDLSAPEEEM